MPDTHINPNPHFRDLSKQAGRTSPTSLGLFKKTIGTDLTIV
jgi:hypothetical protein